MIEDINKFLDSHLLEDYILGNTSSKETREIEDLIASNQEVRTAYNDLQENIELMARQAAVNPPPQLRSKILKSLESAPGEVRPLKRLYWPMAAAVAALVFAGSTIILMQQNQELKSQMAEVNDQMQFLSNQFEAQKATFANLEAELSISNDPNTQRLILTGNENAPAFSTIAYWNESRAQGYLKIMSMPDLPDRQCFQMWVDVDGEMLSLGVIPDDGMAFVPLPFKSRGESLNVTIEPEGGSDHPDVSNLVASVTI